MQTCRYAAILILISLVTSVLTGCSSMDVASFKDKAPPFRIEEFFKGRTIGEGIFFDRFGKVQTSFVVTLEGSYEGEIFNLKEDLVYENGEKLERIYRIKKLDDHRYEVTNADLVGPGLIESYGNTLKWTYTLNQKIGESIWALNFEDWMFLQPKGTVLNRAYASKLGIGIGEVFMSIRKAD